MNCDEIREKLPDYPDSIIDPNVRESIEEHLAVCPNCKEEQEALAKAHAEICRVMETTAAKASLSPNTWALIKRRMSGKRRRWIPTWSSIRSTVTNWARAFWARPAWQRAVSFVLIAAIMTSAMVVTSIAGMSSAPPTVDVTDTAKGSELIAETVTRWNGWGNSYEVDDLEAYVLRDGDYLIAPKGSEIIWNEVRTGNGSERALAPFILPPADNNTAAEATGTDVSSILASSHFARVRDGVGRVDHVYVLRRVLNEKGPTSNVFEVEHYATARSQSGWNLTDIRIVSQPQPRNSDESNRMRNFGFGGPHYTWFPPGQTTTIDNPALGTSLYDTYHFEVGETFITWHYFGGKGKYQIDWSGKVEGQDRAIGYMAGTTTAEEDWVLLGAPRFSLHASFNCYPI